MTGVQTCALPICFPVTIWVAGGSLIFLPLIVFGVVYAAIIAINQPNLKKLIAFASLSHVGVIALGLLSNSAYGIQGEGYVDVWRDFSVLLPVVFGEVAEDCPPGARGKGGPDDDDRVRLYESHVDLGIPTFAHMMDGAVSGIPLPYKVTVEKDSQKILAIYRNWREGDPKFRKRNYFGHVS